MSSVTESGAAPGPVVLRRLAVSIVALDPSSVAPHLDQGPMYDNTGCQKVVVDGGLTRAANDKSWGLFVTDVERLLGVRKDTPIRVVAQEVLDEDTALVSLSKDIDNQAKQFLEPQLEEAWQIYIQHGSKIVFDNEFCKELPGIQACQLNLLAYAMLPAGPAVPPVVPVAQPVVAKKPRTFLESLPAHHKSLFSTMRSKAKPLVAEGILGKGRLCKVEGVFLMCFGCLSLVLTYSWPGIHKLHRCVLIMATSCFIMSLS